MLAACLKEIVPDMSIITAFLGLIFVTLVSGLVFLGRKLSSQDTSTHADKTAELLNKATLDLTERMIRTTTEMRETTTDRLAKHFADTQERIERTLGQNRTDLQTGLQKTTEALEGKFKSLEEQVGKRLETIGQNVEVKLNENLKEGFKHFEKVQQHLQSAELKLASLNVVGQSISDLNNLLKLPHLRGEFGETILEQLLADFLPVGSYELQYQVVPNSPERVDAVVKLAKQILPIDSKFPREQVEPLYTSQDPALIDAARKTLSEWIRGQARTIAQKYIRPDYGTTDMALLFLPSEMLYFEIIRDTALFDAMAKLKVFPVSPNTLAISLKSVSMAQDYYTMARGVEKTIEDVTKARKHFEHFETKFEDIGKGLKKAQEAFETANTHLGRYESSIVRLVGDTGESEPVTLSLPPVAE